jgi:hypothetical protein
MAIALYKLDKANLYRFEEYPETKYSLRGHVLAYSAQRNRELVLAIILVDASPYSYIDEIIEILAEEGRSRFQKFIGFFADPSNTIEAFAIWPDRFNSIDSRPHVQRLNLAWNPAACRYGPSTGAYISFDDARAVLRGIIPDDILKDWQLPADLRTGRVA